VVRSRGTIAVVSLYRIEASGDLRVPLAEPRGFLLAAMRDREVPATLIAWLFNA
jgi:hypothetical protein